MKKSISIVLLATILLHSCRAYYPSTISLKEAYDKKGESYYYNKGHVKVTTTQGDNFHFHYIDLKDSIYYGVKMRGNVIGKEIPLDTAIISGVYLKNFKKSTWKTVFMTLGLIVLSLGILIGIELALYRPFGV